MTIILTILVKILNIIKHIAKGLLYLVKLCFKPFLALSIFVIKPIALKLYKYYLLIKNKLDKSPLLKSRIGLIVYNRNIINIAFAIIAITLASTNILQAAEATSEEIVVKANFDVKKHSSYINTSGIAFANILNITEASETTDNSNITDGEINWPIACNTTPTTYWGHVNNARDFACPIGTPIYAAESGTVHISFTGQWGHGYGNAIDLYSDNGLMTRYAHMSNFNVNEGDYVNRGDVLGYVGMTGRTTGPHLHFEVWINGIAHSPLNYL
jgi:murein DD-endopeptidase MepM/ murein hydrolase activator NlpD